MADEKLSALTEVTSSADADLLYTVQNGNSRKTTRAKVISPTVRHDIDQALLAAAKEKARQNISAAALDSTGIVPRNQLPASLFAGTGTVDSEAEMLALDVPVGFTAVRTDIDKNFVLNALPASDLANWVELASPTAPVLSVSGKQGAVELEVADIVGLDEDLDDIQAAMLVKSTQTLTAAEKGQVRSNIGAGVLSGWRQKLANGNFAWWQRGTVFSGGSQYTADRWAAITGAGATLDVDRITWTRPTGKYAVRLARPVTGAQTSYFIQRVEDVTTLAGSRVTVTFFAKTEAGSKTLEVGFTQYFGEGGSADDGPTNQIITINETAKKISLVFDLPSLAGKIIGVNDYLTLALVIPAAAGNFVRGTSGIILWDFSLVEGDARAEENPYVPPQRSVELDFIRRYYEEVHTGGAWVHGVAGYSGENQARVLLGIKTKRNTPVIGFVGGFSYFNGSWVDTSMTPYLALPDIIQISWAIPSGITPNGVPAWLCRMRNSNDTVQGKIILNSEL